MKYPPVQYHDYLQLDRIIGSVKLRSAEFGKPSHEEHLFIVVHQAYEIWFQHMLFELDSVLEMFKQVPLPEENVGLIVSRLERVVEIQKLINQQIDVLETMTPMEFLEFRDYLYPASGFQSFQWRLIETKMGLKTRVPFTDSPFYKALLPAQAEQVQSALRSPTLFSVIEQWLERLPFASTSGFEFWQSYSKAVESMLSEDERTINMMARLGPEEKKRSLAQIDQVRQQLRSLSDPGTYQELKNSGHFHLSQKALQAALFIQLYREKPMLHLPHRLIQTLMNLEQRQTEWRTRHAEMVHRMLGKKIGTGGSSGHDYLKATATQHKVFVDFFNLSSFYIAGSARPKLPKEIEQRLDF